MPRVSFPITTGTALALCLPASAAFADLTSAEVWADWQSYMETSGYEVSASQATDGATLTVSDLTMVMDLGEDAGEGTARITMESLRFVDQGDGSVSIELPKTTSVDVSMIGEDGEDIDFTIAFDQDSPVMTVTGDPTNLTYTYAVPSATIGMSGLSVDSVPIGPDVAKLAVDMTDISYVTSTTIGDLRGIDQTGSVAAIAYDVAFTDPAGEGSFKLTGGMDTLGYDGTMALPVESDPQDMNAMLNDGFEFDGVITSTGGNYDLSFNSPDGSGTANSTSQGGEIKIAMGAAGLLYDVVQRNMNVNVLVTEFPLPLSFSAAEAGTSVQMPLQKSNEQQDFGMTLELSDFTMSDVIWGLFDPTGRLPRDPATLLVDLGGKAKVLFDFLDPAQAEVLEQSGAAPGELNALTLNTLELDAVGAKLTGAGSFTFDNSDTVTFDGVPRPLGALDLTLAGGNGLLDKLVGMGLVPEEQAMGARLMMGLFAVPGDSPDTLNSRIEVNPEGHVLANGQRIR